MAEHLQHDPRTKKMIKDLLFDHLYRPIREQHKQRIDTLIVKNTLLGRYSHKSFLYKNVVYSCDNTPPPRRSNALHPSLLKEMQTYLKDLAEINEQEIPYVIGYINQVLNASNNLQDYLRLLPEALHPPVRELIATCPCHNKSISDDVVQEIKTKNKEPISLMKQRMVINLII